MGKRQEGYGGWRGTGENNSRREGLSHRTCLLTLLLIGENAVLVLLIALIRSRLSVLLFDDLEAAVHGGDIGLVDHVMPRDLGREGGREGKRKRRRSQHGRRDSVYEKITHRLRVLLRITHLTMPTRTLTGTVPFLPSPTPSAAAPGAAIRPTV